MSTVLDKLLSSLNIRGMNMSPTEIDLIVQEICSEIKLLLADSTRVSPLLNRLPRRTSKLDKKTGIASKLIERLYLVSDKETRSTLDDLSEEERVELYIKYSQLNAQFKKRFKESMPVVPLPTTSITDYQSARGKSEKEVKMWCTLKNKPPTEAVLDPTAMPVDIAPPEEFVPFYDFLSSNQEVPKGGYIVFPRGAVYSDGRVDLCKQGVGSLNIQQVVNSFQHNPYITHFLLGNNIVDITDAKAIANFITSNHKDQDVKDISEKDNDVTNNQVAKSKSHIKTWYLAGNRLDSQGISIISKALEKDTDSQALWLKRNPVKIQGAKYLSDMLRLNKTLEILDLTNTGIQDSGAIELFKALKDVRGNSGLRHLYIDANALTNETCKAIFDYYNDDNGPRLLESLWMDMNRFGDEGAETLAKALLLPGASKLKRLVIGANRLTSMGAEVLCLSLAKHPSLTMLDMGMYLATAHMGELCNRLNDDGALHVGKLIEQNTTLRILNVSFNSMTDTGHQVLLESLKKNSTLLHLDCAEYAISTSTYETEIEECLNTNCMNSIYKMSHKDYVKRQLKFDKHTENIVNIDSIYRNNMKDKKIVA